MSYWDKQLFLKSYDRGFLEVYRENSFFQSYSQVLYRQSIFLMLDVFVGEYLPKCAKDRYEKNFLCSANQRGIFAEIVTS